MGFMFSKKKVEPSSDTESDEYTDLHSDDMKSRIETFVNRSNSTEERLVALRKVGLFIHTAGPVGEEIVLEEFMPVATGYLLHTSTPDIVRCQLLQTLGVVCAGRARVVTFMRKYPNLIRGLVVIIGCYQQPVMARWACYLAAVMISDSPKTMEAFSEIDDLEDNLDAASCMKGWAPFGGNIAFQLMKLFGFRQPYEEEFNSRSSTPGRSRSARSRSSGRRIVTANAE